MTGETLTIRESRGKLIIYLCGLVVFLTGGVWLALDTPDIDTFSKVLLWGLIALLAFVALEGLRRMIWPCKLILDAAGFSFGHWSSRKVGWDEVERFKIVYMRSHFLSRRITYEDSGPGLAHVAWTLKSGARHDLAQRASLVLTGIAGVIPKSMQMGASELFPIMETWRARHAASSQDA